MGKHRNHRFKKGDEIQSSFKNAKDASSDEGWKDGKKLRGEVIKVDKGSSIPYFIKWFNEDGSEYDVDWMEENEVEAWCANSKFKLGNQVTLINSEINNDYNVANQVEGELKGEIVKIPNEPRATYRYMISWSDGKLGWAREDNIKLFKDFAVGSKVTLIDINVMESYHPSKMKDDGHQNNTGVIIKDDNTDTVPIQIKWDNPEYDESWVPRSNIRPFNSSTDIPVDPSTQYTNVFPVGSSVMLKEIHNRNNADTKGMGISNGTPYRKRGEVKKVMPNGKRFIQWTFDSKDSTYHYIDDIVTYNDKAKSAVDVTLNYDDIKYPEGTFVMMCPSYFNSEIEQDRCALIQENVLSKGMVTRYDPVCSLSYNYLVTFEDDSECLFEEDQIAVWDQKVIDNSVFGINNHIYLDTSNIIDKELINRATQGGLKRKGRILKKSISRKGNAISQVAWYYMDGEDLNGFKDWIEDKYLSFKTQNDIKKDSFGIDKTGMNDDTFVAGSMKEMHEMMMAHEAHFGLIHREPSRIFVDYPPIINEPPPTRYHYGIKPEPQSKIVDGMEFQEAVVLKPKKKKKKGLVVVQTNYKD